ncbi:MAG TPA: amidase [Planctomycetota bacterium]|nr:amidase [Planctomycetota bacterium]
MNRRTFLHQTTLGAAALASCAAPSPQGRPLDLGEATIADLRAARATAVSLTEKYLARIAELDKSGPALNAVIELNPDALEIARALDREAPRGPLHGIPVLIKDNIDTHDRMTTTAGSLALEGSIAPRDSDVARRLREAGAVILGKTNLSEWANFRASPSTSGWSGRGGLTRNPYALDRNPSGSSSGSAVAVSAGLCAVAVGTETDGSIVSPSSLCGIVGIKPTVGLIGGSGIIPIAHSQDTAGPMARTVTDAAILLGALADKRRDYATSLDPDGLRGARIGVARKFFRTGTVADRILDASIGALKERGAVVVDPADLPTHGTFGGAEYEVLLYEFKTDLNAYLSGLGPKAPVHSLQEVIEFNEKHKAREMPFFGQETLIRAQAKGPLTEKAYLDALEKCRRLSRNEGIDAVMTQHRLDAIVAPTTGPAAKTDLVHGDRGVGGSSGPAAVAGYPSVTLPMGEVFGLPVGISFFGRAWSEPVLLKLAFAFEQATRARRTPKFPPTIG